MKKTVLCALLAFGATFGVVSYARFAAADAPPVASQAQAQSQAQAPVLVAEADVPTDAGPVTLPAVIDAGAGSAVVPAPATTPPPILTPTSDDIGVLQKLWKAGSFFAMGVIALYLGLAVWAKLDKKHAWYAATAAGALAVLIEAIRKGDSPTATSVVSVLGPLVGVMIKGPAA